MFLLSCLLTVVFTVLMYGYYTTVNLLKVNGSSFNDLSKCIYRAYYVRHP